MASGLSATGLFRVWLSLLALGLLSLPAGAQQILPPPCDSQNSAHRQAVELGLEIYDAFQIRELVHSLNAGSNAAHTLTESLERTCAEVQTWTLITQANRWAQIYELEGSGLGFGNREDLAPLLDKWQVWAEAFLDEELKTQFWVGSFDNYQGRGIRVGCDSYLLPVDTGLERGSNTLAELSLALSALFDPAHGHPAADLETEDWIKQLGLSVAGIHIADGLAEITLGGQLRGIGTCGDAILEAQILQTVFQFSDIKRARISDGETNLLEIVDMSELRSPAERETFIYDRTDLNWLRD